MIMKSIWELEREDTQDRSSTYGKEIMFPQGMHIKTLVIGAGITGILTAYFLSKRGYEVIVVEKDTIASGQTGRTTAKITAQHGLVYEKMIRQMGWEKARDYALANAEAIGLYEKLIYQEGIFCDFEKQSAYLYALSEANTDLLRKEVQAAVSLGVDAHYVTGEALQELPFEVTGAACFENQAQFHPIKFIRHLAKDLTIYENTQVIKVKGHTAITNRGKITAEHIVFATHYPIVNVPGFYFLRQHQERSYVLALKTGQALQGMYYGVEKNGLSLRTAGDVVLLGGGGHRTGKKTGEACSENTTIGYGYLRKMAQVYFPEAEEVGAWSAQDCISHDELPFIGEYSCFRPYWYVATGYKKWGMTSAMIAALIISNRICGGSQIKHINPALFSPRRMLLRASVKAFLMDMCESLWGLSRGWLGGKKHRCAHMGCRLEWNGEEGSYDCPCHGSRFDENGCVLDNPSQKDKKK